MNGLKANRGFTLVEIMIVVAIIGLLSAIAIPNALQAGRNARTKRFASDIKTAGHTFMHYSIIHGKYPADVTPGIMPEGMAPYLSAFPWEEKTSIGGNWDWDYKVFGIIAAVSVKGDNITDEKMIEIDALMDDGNLNTGKFRKRSGGYMYVLEESL